MYIGAWIPNSTALPFGRLAQRGGASIAIFQQKNMRVSPKGMGERAPQEDVETGYSFDAEGKRYSCAQKWRVRNLLTEYDPLWGTTKSTAIF